MNHRRNLLSTFWVAALVGALVIPSQSLAAVALGSARGVRTAALSLDGRGGWLSLANRSLPVMSGSRLRTTTGAVAVDLADGSRLVVMPFSAVRVDAAAGAAAQVARVSQRSGAAVAAAEVTLEYGRLGFQVRPSSRLSIVTSTARVSPVSGRAAAGEVLAAPTGTTGVRMASGTVTVRETTGARRTLEVGRTPVFVPGPPPPGAAFSADVPAAAPSGARAVFTAEGENVGYVGRDGQVVVQPGFARDLAQPYPRQVVQGALARIPFEARGEAVVLLDANAGYVGFVREGLVYAAAGDRPPLTRVAQATEGAAEVPDQDEPAAEKPRITRWPWHYTVGVLAVVGGAAAAATGELAGSDSDGDPPATPVGP
ncbi:MAG TPA: hypothetical protein VF406_13430 [Thermodesulfobacteriota bacterium]